MKGLNLSFNALLQAYRSGALTPEQVVEHCLAAIAASSENPIWIRPLTRDELEPYLAALRGRNPALLPLYGVPFAIKDNIDLAGIPTTAGCPEYAYTPTRSATVVERLIAAGAIPLGKTNLDQFATGLVGSRSPYGACQNAFDPAYLSGGSSAGSAVAVAKGQVSFSLGTDTAGSGRVPAAFNNLVGLKPTRGALSTRGVVPACRSLDCVSIFALESSDAAQAFLVASALDEEDPYSREMGTEVAFPPQFVFGVPRTLEFFGDAHTEACFNAAVATLTVLGGEAREVDLQPMLDAARLLYEGPWVAERYAAIRAFIEAQPEALYPVTRQIIAPAIGRSAVEAFEAQYRLQALKRTADKVMATVDFVLTPTAGTIYRRDEDAAEPIRLNSNLGYYTNFMNLLDYAAVAVPAGFCPQGLPRGVTLFAQAFQDLPLLAQAERLHAALGFTLGATGHSQCSVWAPPAADVLRIAVCGAHMAGLPLNHELSSRGAQFVAATRTANRYRLYALAGGPPRRPGMVQVATDGAALELELWDLPLAAVGSFMAGIPAPLGIGTVQLANGERVKGFLCEMAALDGAEDITHFGGWRHFLNA